MIFNNLVFQTTIYIAIVIQTQICHAHATAVQAYTCLNLQVLGCIQLAPPLSDSARDMPAPTYPAEAVFLLSKVMAKHEVIRQSCEECATTSLRHAKEYACPTTLQDGTVE